MHFNVLIINYFWVCSPFWELIFWFYFVATALQLVVWYGIFARLGFQKAASINSISAPATILICARNEAENLRRFLPSILAQQFDYAWELLVVDDASEDETPAVLRFFQEKNPARMRVLRIEMKTDPGKKFALAQGISAAKHDLLLLTDADCQAASPNWLAQMIGILTAKPETEIVLGYGPNFVPKARNRVLKNWFRYETAFVANQYLSFALAGMPYMGVGRNLAFKRQIYDRVGGFSRHLHLLSGDDDLLVNAAATARNTAICVHPDAFMYSESPSDWAAWLRQKQRHLSAGPSYRWRHKIVLAGVSASQLGHYVLFLGLLWMGVWPGIVLGLFLLRQLSLLWVFGKNLRVLHEPGLFWQVPLYDLLLAGYYGTLVPWFLIRGKLGKFRGRNVMRWK
jgi:glycosyltransferase involved in cell wall biosynthesis